MNSKKDWPKLRSVLAKCRCASMMESFWSESGNIINNINNTSKWAFGCAWNQSLLVCASHSHVAGIWCGLIWSLFHSCTPRCYKDLNLDLILVELSKKNSFQVRAGSGIVLFQKCPLLGKIQTVSKSHCWLIVDSTHLVEVTKQFLVVSNGDEWSLGTTFLSVLYVLIKGNLTSLPFCSFKYTTCR